MRQVQERSLHEAHIKLFHYTGLKELLRLKTGEEVDTGY